MTGQIKNLPKSGVVFCGDCVTLTKKMAEEEGFDARTQSEASRSDSDGNPQKSEQAHFLQILQKITVKRKSSGGKILFSKLLLAFYRDCVTLTKKMAEEEGFEPSESCPSAVFKTAALNHSTILPHTFL